MEVATSTLATPLLADERPSAGAPNVQFTKNQLLQNSLLHIVFALGIYVVFQTLSSWSELPSVWPAVTFCDFTVRLHNVTDCDLTAHYVIVTHWSCEGAPWLIPKPPDYPTPSVMQLEQMWRKMYYINAMFYMGCFGVFGVILAYFGRKLIRPGKPMEAAPTKTSLRNWVCIQEALDWSVVLLIASRSGCFFDSGIYWEDWLKLYCLIVALPLSESLVLGMADPVNVAVALFPFVSPRFVRFKDKIQAAILVTAVPGNRGLGIALAAWSTTITLLSQRHMVASYPDEFMGSFFTLSRAAKKKRRFQGASWKEWFVDKAEPSTKTGKIVYAIVHDIHQALLVCVVVAVW
jgi:hypothetical protein